jgi:6-phosphogluconolactonase (cycloisomerase 2 family)
MNRGIGLAVGAGIALTIAGLAAPLGALAEGRAASGGDHAVFVQTNDPTGNQVVSYVRGPHGQLSFAGRYDTGGLGAALSGAVVDKLASQGGLAYDAHESVLIAVNGGSNSITAFRVNGGHLSNRLTAASGGATPVSVAVAGNRVYVLNAGGRGAVQGFFATTLRRIPGSARSLNLTPGLTPQFLNTPGQIGLTPDRHHLVVTTKANGSAIDVFSVSAGGALSPTPVVTPSATPVPFGFTFDAAGDLVVAEAGTSALTTYRLHADGTLTRLASVTNGEAALCWVAGAGHELFYGADAGSATVTGYRIGAGGRPGVVSETPTDSGPIDLAASPDGSFLYVETGASGIVDSFQVHGDGSLGFTGSSVAPELPGHSGLEGIAVN